MKKNKPVYVHKLGGATAGHAPYVIDLTNSLGDSHYENCNIVIVCSAFAGVTQIIDAIFYIICMDKLTTEEKIKLITPHLSKFNSTHKDIIKTLFEKKKNFIDVKNDFNSHYELFKSLVFRAVNCLTDLEFLKNDDEKHSYLQAKMLKYGEICSTKILSHHLHISRFEFEYIDARTFMKTNFKKQNDFSVKYDHNDVEIDFEETSRLIKQKFEGPFREGKIVICSGFIAQDVNTGDDTTLGYDGSDWSAGIIARVLKAVSLCLWKDVDGLMSNDPDVELNAYLIKSSSFNDAISLCEKNGRWPILRKALEVCRDGCIAIYLRPASDVKSLGTKIYG